MRNDPYFRAQRVDGGWIIAYDRHNAQEGLAFDKQALKAKFDAWLESAPDAAEDSRAELL